MATEIEERASSAPTAEVVRWLTKWADALAAGDVDAATAVFHDESYWRDLVSFTWNIATVGLVKRE